MSEIKDLKVGQEFVILHPNYMWFMETAFVGIKYSEYKITKINEKSIRVCEKLENGSWRRDINWSNIDGHDFYSKNIMVKNVMKNTKTILESYDRNIAKYTKVAFQHWYLKAQKRMVEIIYDLVQEGELTLEGVKKVKPLIDKENKILEIKLKELEGCEK